MNAKAVKRFRRQFRELGVDPTERRYSQGKAGYRMIQTSDLDINGAPKFKRVAITGTTMLDPKCGRAMYQAAKQEARQ